MRTRPRSICLVIDDRDSVNSEGAWMLASRLRAEGRKVHVLSCGHHPPATTVPVSTLDDVAPAAWQVRNIHGDCPSDRSDRVQHTLAHLHNLYAFDLIAFPAQGGLGFRSIQAQRMGLVFPGVILAVRLDSCTSWQREQNNGWPAGPEDLEVDFIERYAFEHAGAQIAPDSSVLDHVRRDGWLVRSPVRSLDEVSSLPEPVESLSGDLPLVSICIPYFNLAKHLPETLASLAAQTWPNLEVLVIDDGSTDPASIAIFEEMQRRYPRFRFVRQTNAGIGATRNRGLREAKGEYFIPVDADNIARADMVERFVTAIHSHPDLTAVSCYFLAFRDTSDLDRGEYRYAYRPTGGPHVLGCMRNVYGDANAIYRTKAFRAVGGWETDRDTSWEDWEAFVKLVNAGHAIDVIPDHLFYYRHLETGFSRTTAARANHQRVLRQFTRLSSLPRAEGVTLWNALVGFQRRIEQAEARDRSLRHRIADRLHAACRLPPVVRRGLRQLLLLMAWPERP
jgi:GT2 family glycosyltransferase